MINIVLCRMDQCLSSGVEPEKRDDGQANREVQKYLDEAAYFRRALAIAREMKHYPPSKGELDWMEKSIRDNERWAAECLATSKFLTGR